MLRFAPSPNGPLHLGHALSILANEQMARALDRPLTLRIEDIDVARARPQHVAAIVADMTWLGVDWQPPMRRQSDHFGDYADALARLRRRGLVYPSFATRREIAEAARRIGAPRDPDGAPLFPGDDVVLGSAEAARRRASDEPAAWRLSMARAAGDDPVVFEAVDWKGERARSLTIDPRRWGDVVLARKETPTSYHLSVVVDDAAQGISHVVRGADLHAAAAVQRLIQRLLGLPAPRYHHHALVLGSDGRKLSKSTGAESLGALREAGWDAAAVRAHLAPLMRLEAEQPEPQGEGHHRGGGREGDGVRR